jgi:putative DNA primase/helicase
MDDKYDIDKDPEIRAAVEAERERITRPKSAPSIVPPEELEQRSNGRSNGKAGGHRRSDSPHLDDAAGRVAGDHQNNVLPPPSVPMAVARVFVGACTHEGVLTLRHWRGGWWEWKKSHWREIEYRAVRSTLYRFTEQASYLTDEGEIKPWAPNRRKIGDLSEALAAIAHLPDHIDQPSWLDDRTTGVVVACANGLLDVEHRRLIWHTPLFFNQTAVPFDYDPQARSPERWLNFLTQIWPSEPAAIDVLAEWFGYIVGGRTDLHKILLMVGPTRGGKGVIARILGALIGPQNVAGPTLSSLGGEFGLAPLIGKPLAIISDARFAGKNANIVVERLLSISGEDTLTVNIKFREQWCGKLPSRLHVISNELPKLGDASTAIIGRIVLLLLSHSWLGKEDHGLERALQDELTGILNWGLAGLHRLTVHNTNRFTCLPYADEAITTMRDLASPVAAFVREQCEIGADRSVPIDTLYGQYKIWAENNGHPKPAKHVFGRDLKAAVSSVRGGQVGPRATRVTIYHGIALRQKSDDELGLQ